MCGFQKATRSVFFRRLSTECQDYYGKQPVLTKVLLLCLEQGMQDFVKEPVLGLLKSVEDLAPEELMHGMARGAGSLLNHSVGGVANSVSLITGRNKGCVGMLWLSIGIHRFLLCRPCVASSCECFRCL